MLSSTSIIHPRPTPSFARTSIYELIYVIWNAYINTIMTYGHPEHVFALRDGATTAYLVQYDMQVEDIIARVIKPRHILWIEICPKIIFLHFEVFTWLQHECLFRQISVQHGDNFWRTNIIYVRGIVTKERGLELPRWVLLYQPYFIWSFRQYRLD